ncbi:MAG: Enolase [Parcubacteria group bacterium ADurb.Bin247]|nr:MAG: Enolase [Parcubacteria group bacterium ADurb.Bin247]
MSKIKSIEAREILDSRGNPTVEVCLETSDGFFVSSVPSGASAGSYEAVELRDLGKRYHGKGVLKAVNNINDIISKKLKGGDCLNQEELDNIMIELDGTQNKKKLGGNAILGVSMAICRAGAFSKNLSLYNYINSLCSFKMAMPKPSLNVINGGKHAANELEFQEFMIAPFGVDFEGKLRKGVESYHNLKKIIAKNHSVNIGDEGGFAPNFKDPEEALKLLSKLGNLDIIIDVAAGEFFNGKKYDAGFKVFNSKELCEYYLKIIKKYPIRGIEDPFAEDDIQAWQMLTKLVNNKILIIGDDLLATNPERIKMAGKEGLCNAMIVKLNQVGTLTETLESVKIARGFGWKIIVSHRSGETTDDFISDFAVGIGADYIKSGAPARGERVCKYNRLLKIEAEWVRKLKRSKKSAPII